MPDYLGKDQRRVREDDTKEDKPFQGEVFSSDKEAWLKLQVMICVRCCERICPFTVVFLAALDEGDIELLKTYVSEK